MKERTNRMRNYYGVLLRRMCVTPMPNLRLRPCQDAQGPTRMAATFDSCRGHEEISRVVRCSCGSSEIFVKEPARALQRDAAAVALSHAQPAACRKCRVR